MIKKENKTKIVTLRFRPSDLKELNEKAQEVMLTRSAYISRKLMGLPILPTRIPKVNWQLYHELSNLTTSLAAIANNINQIAKVLNRVEKRGETIPESLPNTDDLNKTLELMKTILPLLTEVRLCITGVRENNTNNDRTY